MSAMSYGLAIETAEPAVVPELRLYRGVCNARLERYRLAVEDIEITQTLTQLSGTQAYEAAVVYALALPQLAADVTQSDASKNALDEYYAQQAVALLLRDWETSEYGPEESLQFLEEDEELDALRGRPQFEAMMTKLRAEVAGR